MSEENKKFETPVLSNEFKFEFCEIPYVQIEDTDSYARFQNCRNHSKNWDMVDLKTSLREEGLYFPLIVWEHPFKDGAQMRPWSRELVKNQLTLIAGFRRHEAISLLREEDDSLYVNVPCFIFRGTVEEAAKINFVENIQRVNLTPIEVCNHVSYLKTEMNYKQKELASLIGKSPEWVSRACSFVEKATPPLMALARGEYLLSGKRIDESDGLGDEWDRQPLQMSFSAALEVAEFDQDQQIELVDDFIKNYRVNGKKAAVKATKEELSKLKDDKSPKEKKEKPRKLDDINIQLRDYLEAHDDVSALDDEQRGYIWGIQTALHWAGNPSVPDDGSFWSRVAPLDEKKDELEKSKGLEVGK